MSRTTDAVGYESTPHAADATHGDHAEIRPVESLSRGERIVRALAGTATGGLSTDEVMALTRGDG